MSTKKRKEEERESKVGEEKSGQGLKAQYTSNLVRERDSKMRLINWNN